MSDWSVPPEDYNEFVAWTQRGKKSVPGKKKATATLVPDLQARVGPSTRSALQAALSRSEEEAAALASMPFEAVMSITDNGILVQNLQWPRS